MPFANPCLSITDLDFNRLRELIHAHTGIALSDHKRALMCSRLAKRLRFLNLSSYAEYFDHLTQTDAEGHELREMINAITTNKTDFFRESHHFDYLASNVFPALKLAKNRRLRLWSAGTSTGEEAYTLAITLQESFGGLMNEWDIRILATDIDSRVLEAAKSGVYTQEQLQQVPEELRKRYFLKGLGENHGRVHVKPLLQKDISFRLLNLIDRHWPMHGPFDVIFCRNVMIYFSRTSQQELFERFARYLRPGGYLMLGHAEFIHGLEEIYSAVGHSIYMRREGRSS